MRSDTFITSVCVECGVTFTQRDDPGSRREYHNNACRQRAYRRRNSERLREQRRAEEEAWIREEARKEQERQRAYRRRHGGRSPKIHLPDDCYPQPGDTPLQAEKRRLLRSVCERELGTTYEGERENCRHKAEKLRRTYGLRV